MLLYMLLGAHPGLDSDPFARYEAFRRAHPTFEVTLAGFAGGRQRMAGTLRLQPPRHLLYKAKYGGYDYSLSLTEKGYLEIERSTRTYDELEDPGFLAIYDSDINGTANTMFPRFLLVKNLGTWFPGGANRTVTRKAGYDEVHLAVTGPMGNHLQMWLDVDDDGRPTLFRRRSDGPLGAQELEWRLSGYKYPGGSGLSALDTPLPLGAFLTPLPLGYVPYSIPRMRNPIEIGKSAPVQGWTAPDGTKNADLLTLSKHSPFLLAYLGDGQGPARAAKQALIHIKGHLPVFVVGAGGFRDPNGRLIKQLGVPASPMFYLIDGVGTVEKLWMGYDPQHSAEFESDVEKSATQPPAKRKG